MPHLQRLLLLAAPFVLIALLHYGRFATLRPSGMHDVATRAKAQNVNSFRAKMARRAQSVAASAASTAAAAASSAVTAASSAASAASTAAVAATALVASSTHASDGGSWRPRLGGALSFAPTDRLRRALHLSGGGYLRKSSAPARVHQAHLPTAAVAAAASSVECSVRSRRRQRSRGRPWNMRDLRHQRKSSGSAALNSPRQSLWVVITERHCYHRQITCQIRIRRTKFCSEN